LRLFAGSHQDDSFYGVAVLVEAELSEPRRGPDHDFTDILHQNGSAVVDREDDLADVVGGLEASDSADVVELAALGIESAAGIPVVRAERGGHVGDRESGPGETRRVEQNLILHGETAER